MKTLKEFLTESEVIDVKSRIPELVKRVNAMKAEYNKKMGYTFNADETIIAKEGPKYFKLIVTKNGKDSSVYCFVDKTTGGILKAATWNAPAKGIRSMITADDYGMSGLNEYGANYKK